MNGIGKQDNGWKKYLEVLEIKSKESFTPLSATFELTPICNFKCKMCYVRLDTDLQKKQHDLISYNQWIDLAKRCKEIGVLFLTLTGGEILTLPYFWDLYETLYDMGFFVNLMTNGYLIDQKSIEKLKKRKPYKMRITLYGNNNEVYESVCGIKNGFEIVSKNIQELKNSGINVAASMTVIKDNINDLEEIKNWTRNNDIPFVHTCRIHLPRIGVENLAREVRVVPDDFGSDLVFSSEYGEYNEKIKSKLKENAFSYCKSYKNHFVVSWDGRIKGCMSISTVQKDIFEGNLIDNFRNVWNLLDNIKVPEKCLSCEFIDFCGYCPGTVAAESGDPEKIEPYICAMAKWNYNNYVNKKEKQSSMVCE